MSSGEKTSSFKDFGLSKPILKALNDVGYETPSPIQEQCIAHLLEGKDIIGQAQTGTGKTAAFALPLIDQIDVKNKTPQVLVLAPTRELAIQVAEAIQSYAHHIKGFTVLPIYGGQAYPLQLRPLKRGVHVVVGTPGRVMDHIKRGTLALDGLKALVLDEADEMLRMGFLEAVEWVMEKTPANRQVALFSATMPRAIQKIAERFLNQPEIIKIKTKTTTATTIRQRVWMVSGTHKLDALTRILEVEPFDGMLIFVRTKTATTELADKLSARGFAAQALNGDIAQNQRERIVNELKKGRIDILIATDVAARGLDVERISHVINYDIPYDPESYVHRIGRTGRAGRSGEAILFVAPRERRMLRTIEKVSRQKIAPMKLPTAKNINEQRIKQFKQKITDTLANQDQSFFEKLLTDYYAETEAEPLQVAAALAQLAQGSTPLLVSEKPPVKEFRDRGERDRGARGRDGGKWEDRRGDQSRQDKRISGHAPRLKNFPDIEMCRYKLEVGKVDEVTPSQIVGAIANEAELDSCYMGNIDIYDDFATIDLPAGMPKEAYQAIKKARVCGKPLNISELNVPKARYRAGPKKRNFKSKGKSDGRPNQSRHRKGGSNRRPRP